MTIDHIGVVVRDLKSAIEQWETLFGYAQHSDIVENTRQKVRVVFLAKENSLPVKLLEAISDDSPVAAFARRGGGLHHVCFRCENMDSQISFLQEHGTRVLVSPEPGEAFNNQPIAFLLAGNLNIELIATTEKKGWSKHSFSEKEL
jgi:methylmalonyl-CoA/ethylmalonyl-CoA epimerase